MLKLDRGYHFCHHVCRIMLLVNRQQEHFSTSDNPFDIVKLNIYVFRPSVINLVFRQMNRTLIIREHYRVL